MTKKTVRWATPLEIIIDENKISNNYSRIDIIRKYSNLIKNIFLILFFISIFVFVYLNY